MNIGDKAWQTIESAPKDRVIMLYRPTARGDVCRIGPGNWNDQRFSKNPRPFWDSWISIMTMTDCRLHPPTHWQEMPGPPSEGE